MPSCETCKQSIQSINLMCQDENKIYEFLFDHGLIPRSKNCPRCQKPMTYDEKTHKFKCYKRSLLTKGKKNVSTKCHVLLPVTDGTFFQAIDIPVPKVVQFIAYWSCFPKMRTKYLVSELNVSRLAILNASQFIRELCFEYLVKNSSKIGGEGLSVELYEAVIGNVKHSSVIKEKFVYAGFDRMSKTFFVSTVTDRTWDQLFNVIEEYIVPKSTVVSDSWRSHEDLDNKNMDAEKEIRSKYMIRGSTNSSYTKGIDRVCSEGRSSVPKYDDKMYHYHTSLAEYFVKKKFADYSTRIHNILCLVAEVFPKLSDPPVELKRETKEINRVDRSNDLSAVGTFFINSFDIPVEANEVIEENKSVKRKISKCTEDDVLTKSPDASVDCPEETEEIRNVKKLRPNQEVKEEHPRIIEVNIKPEIVDVDYNIPYFIIQE